jgi:hypothetical protein
VHLSGNPVPWDVHHGALHREMFVMLHTKHPEYVNWAVRMDRDTHVITHISAGPLLRNQDYRNEVSAVPPTRLPGAVFHFKQLLAARYWVTSSGVSLKTLVDSVGVSTPVSAKN